jgi:uncharacterized protein (TIGR03067 family)
LAGALALGLVIGTAAVADPPRLDGVWRGYVVNGQGERPDQGPIRLELTIKGDVIVARNLNPGADPSLGEGTYRLGATGKTIDATRTSSPGKGQTYAGIYEVTDDTLRWCTGTPGKDRPEEFATRKGQFLLILKRQ